MNIQLKITKIVYVWLSGLCHLTLKATFITPTGLLILTIKFCSSTPNNNRNFHLLNAHYVPGPVLSMLPMSMPFDLHCPVGRVLFQFHRKMSHKIKSLVQDAQLGSSRARRGATAGLAPQSTSTSVCQVSSWITRGKATCPDKDQSVPHKQAVTAH